MYLLIKTVLVIRALSPSQFDTCLNNLQQWYKLAIRGCKRPSAPSCDHSGRHGEWKKYLANKILAKVANWRPTD